MAGADGAAYLPLRNAGDPEFLHLAVVDRETSRNPPARETSTHRGGRRLDATREMQGGVQPSGKSGVEEIGWHRAG